MILWLDDVRDPRDWGFPEATWAKNYDQAIMLLKTGEVTFASLDHDIGACQQCIRAGKSVGDMRTPDTTYSNWCPHAKSGYDVVLWMEENNVWPAGGVRVHSMNPAGASRMKAVIKKQIDKQVKDYYDNL